MKVIKCAPPIKASFPVVERVDGKSIMSDVEKEVDFVKFLQTCIDSFDTFSTGHANARTYDKLCKILEAGPKEGEFWFEDEDFKKLNDAVLAVQWISPKVNRAYLPFYEAVEKVRTEVLATEKKK